jgi:hypothetical protein
MHIRYQQATSIAIVSAVNIIEKAAEVSNSGDVKTKKQANGINQKFDRTDKWKPSTAVSKARLFSWYMTGDEMFPEMEIEEETGPFTMPQALLNKFSVEDFTFGSSPVKQGKEGRLRVPSVLILEACNIVSAGDEETLCQYCGHVRDLDLAHNDLQSWQEVSLLLDRLPTLRHLNLSGNRKLSYKFDISPSNPHINLSSLILNSCSANLATVGKLLEFLPGLEELHLSRNVYKNLDIDNHLAPHATLKSLFFTDNQIEDWNQVFSLSSLFPSLTNLFITSNNLPHVATDLPENLFPNLHSLHLAGNKLDCWDCLDTLDQLSGLKNIRLNNIIFFESFDEVTRRNLAIARLQSITHLNGSAISPSNREDAERFYIRHYLDDEIKPTRYEELVARHGQLSKLGDVDLSPQDIVTLRITCEEIGISQYNLPIKPSITVSQLRTHVSQIVGVKPGELAMIHVDAMKEEAWGVGAGHCHLNIMSVLVSTAGIEDEDEIKIRLL